MKTLQNQYKLIKEGKGHKGVFLSEAKRQFPNYVPNHANFNSAADILKDRGIINENIVSVGGINSPFLTKDKESFEDAFDNFLKEAKKKKEKGPAADVKKATKDVEDAQKKNFDKTDKKDPNNHIFGEIMKGYYCEMKNPKNCDKTEEQLKDMVLKNLAKDPIYYTKNGMFGEEGVGVEMDVPGLGEPKEPKGPHKSSGYGTLKEQKLRKVINTMVREGLNEIENNKYFNMVRREIYDRIYPKYEESLLLKAVNTMEVDKVDIYSLHPEFDVRILQILEEILKKVDSNLTDDFTDPAGGSGLSSHLQEQTLTIQEALGDPLTDEEVDEIYSHYPEVEDPYYKGKKHVGGEDELSKFEEETFEITLPDGEVYRVVSSPINGDLWFPTRLNHPSKSSHLQEQKLRKAINIMVRKQILIENKKAQNTIKEIEKQGKIAEVESKMEAINRFIEEKNQRLTSIDENEDLKELTDKKKVKELKKEIKELEKYAKKCEKIYEKLTKETKKEIIDEDPDEMGEGVTVEDEIPTEEGIETESDISLEEAPSDDIEQIKTDSEEIKKTFDDLANIQLEEEQPSEEQLTSMKGELESYVDKASNPDEAINMYLEKHPDDEVFRTQLMQLADPLF